MTESTKNMVTPGILRVTKSEKSITPSCSANFYIESVPAQQTLGALVGIPKFVNPQRYGGSNVYTRTIGPVCYPSKHLNVFIILILSSFMKFKALAAHIVVVSREFHIKYVYYKFHYLEIKFDKKCSFSGRNTQFNFMHKRHAVTFSAVNKRNFFQIMSVTKFIFKISSWIRSSNQTSTRHYYTFADDDNSNA